LTKIWRLLRWAVFLGIIGLLIAPNYSVSPVSKFFATIFGLIVLMIYLISLFVRWANSFSGNAPMWDEIQSVSPIIPEPPLREVGTIGRALADWSTKWTMNRKDKSDAGYLNAMGEAYDIGTRHTPKSPRKAMQWYLVGGDPTRPGGHEYAKLRIAEMYEDGEGVTPDFETAGRVYKTIPNYPSSLLHFAIAYVEGRGVPRNYVEAFRLLLIADRARSWHPPTRKEVEVNPQRHRENRRHIRMRELMAILEPKLSPEQLMTAHNAAREWWNEHR
jgi:hypothetical protein